MDKNQPAQRISMVLPIDTKELWKGCILALTVNALRLPEYPFLVDEHIWRDGIYITTDHEGSKAALAFSEDNDPLVGVFQDFKSPRTELVLSDKYAFSFFKEAPGDRRELAGIMFPLFEEEIGEQKLPVVTSGFWSEKDEIYSQDTFDDWYEYGGHLLDFQLMPFDEAMESYEKIYHIDSTRLRIIERIYKERIKSPLQEVFLSNREVKTIIEKCPLNKGVCQDVFAGFQVYFEE